MRRAPLMSIFWLFFAVPATAQNFDMMSNWAQQQMLNDNLSRNLNNATSQPRAASSSARAYGIGGGRTAGVAPSFAPGRPGAMTSTTYRADPAVTERVKGQYIDFVAKDAPGDLDKARKGVGPLNVVQVWSQGVASDGLHPGDVADAMASYWVLNWAVANGGDNTRRQTLAVRHNLQPAIASSPAFQRLSQAQRQEMAEALMINFIVQRDVYMHAMQTHDERLIAGLRSAAVTRFQREAGVDLRRIALTDQGFRPRG